MIQVGNFKAHLELHSVNNKGDQAITFVHTHERSATHAEFMTHRVNRNASSARAIPRKRMDAWTSKDPALPLHFGSNRSGMQSGPEIDDPVGARREMLEFHEVSRTFANRLHDHYGLHKEIANRFDETFAWINVVSTWSLPAFMNYVGVRCTPQAEPRIQRLAINMVREFVQSIPQRLKPGEWHMPFVKDQYNLDEGPISIENLGRHVLQRLQVWSVARAAWVSYQTVDERDAEWSDALRRYEDCLQYGHGTPIEHQKCARDDSGRNGGTTPGFDELRHMIPGAATIGYVDLEALLKKYDGSDYLTAE